MEVFLFILFSITKYLVTILTYKQCMVLTLLTILYSTYNTKLAILTYNEILTVLTVLYSTLNIYTEKKNKKKKKLLALLTLRITYATKTRK